jgi:hypothetical protein
MSALADRSASSRSGSVAPRRRVYLLVCLYRIACGILLLSFVLATDTRSLPILAGNWSALFQGGLLLTICVAYLGWVLFCRGGRPDAEIGRRLAAAGADRGPGVPDPGAPPDARRREPILLLPQLAATG